MSFSRNLVLYVICHLKEYLVHKSVCTCDTKVEGFGNQGKGGTQWLTVERVPSLPPPPASVTVCSLYFSLPLTYSKDRWTPAPYNVSPSSCWCWMKGMCTICQTPRRRTWSETSSQHTFTTWSFHAQTTGHCGCPCWVVCVCWVCVKRIDDLQMAIISLCLHVVYLSPGSHVAGIKSVHHCPAEFRILRPQLSLQFLNTHLLDGTFLFQATGPTWYPHCLLSF